MKTTKSIIAIFITLISIGFISSCTKEDVFEKIFIYISTELYDDTIELSFDGNTLNPNSDYSVGNVSVYTLIPHEATAGIDYSFNYNGTHYSSSTSGKLILQASEDESISYTLHPTGDISEPLDINELSDPANDSPIIGNWEKSGGGALLKFTSSQIYLCNASTLVEYSGVFYPSENRAVITEGGSEVTFYAYPNGNDRILIKQYASGQHVEDIYYYKTASYSCN
ncbi:MAG: hypothetical protein GQ527_09545 [Bacteroidales bacterium]|nr:hypothetical protein [Bacteroidales bacterium]